MRSISTAARAAAALVLSCALPCARAQHLPADPVPVPVPLQTRLLLSEVQFDPIGVDGTALNGEWVELYVARDVDIGGWQLATADGTVLATLPPMAARARTAILVLFRGDIPYPYDTDPQDGRAAIALDLPLGDYLANDVGGVRLLSPGGAIKDCVYWGKGSAPAGASGALWKPGTFYDISFAGGQPMLEGDSLGRPVDPIAAYTGTVLDWERQGGVNAAGPTPGGRNGVEVTDATGLKFWVQTGVNQIVNGFGMSVQPGWLSIVDAGVDQSTYDLQQNQYTVTSNHMFNIEVNGVETLFSGFLTAIYSRVETAGAVAFTLTASGTIAADTGASFQFAHSEHWSGYHGPEVRCDASTAVTYREGGIDYPFSVVDTMRLYPKDQDQWVVKDVRTAVDYGGAGAKTSAAETLFTQLGDGSISTNFALVRARPMAPPPLWLAGQQQLSSPETVQIDTASAANGGGELTAGTVSRLDRFINGSLNTSLAPGASGAFALNLTAGTFGTYPQSHHYSFDLPLEQFGTPLRVEGEVTSSLYDESGKVISEADAELRFEGNLVSKQHFFVDPPMQQGGGGGGTTIIIIHVNDNPPPPAPAPPAPQSPPPEAGKTVGGFLGAAATCAAVGAGLGGGAGVIAGGIIGGVVGSAAGGVGALPGAGAGAVGGAAVGAGLGGAAGTVFCGALYLLDWW